MAVPLSKNKPLTFFQHGYSKVLTRAGYINKYHQSNGIFLPQKGEYFMLLCCQQTDVFLVCKLPLFLH